MKTFRSLDRFIYFEGMDGNEGFTLHASFNPIRHQSGSDSLELALKAATFHFAPEKSFGWKWCESAHQFGKEMARDFAIKLSNSSSNTNTTNLGAKAQFQQGLKFSVPALAEVSLQASQHVEGSNTAAHSIGEAAEVNLTERVEYAEFMHDKAGFALSLSSPHKKDLCRLNTELNRLAVLQPPTDVELDPQKVRVKISARYTFSGESIDHAFQIREAGGCWAPLAKSNNKRVITELLISKFLAPLHKPVDLWPRKT